MGGTIGIPTGEFTRFSLFGQSLLGLQKPPETFCVWATGGNVARNCNTIVTEMQGEWVWFIGDDHAFPPDILMNLLARNVDIVVPICAQRQPPYSYGVYQMLEDGTTPLVDLTGKTGLVSVDYAGSAGMLVRRHVFEKIEPPHFRLGQFRADSEGEDIYFCAQARDAGFTIWVDTDHPMGHSAVVTAWPVRWPDGTYGTKLDLGNGLHFNVRGIS